MTPTQFTILLAERVMGWNATPGRFIKSGRSWIPNWRFAPLTSLEDAFLLLRRAAADYTLTTIDGKFSAEVYAAGQTGSAAGESKARTITIALARALGLETPDNDVGLQ